MSCDLGMRNLCFGALFDNSFLNGKTWTFLPIVCDYESVIIHMMMYGPGVVAGVAATP